MHSPATHEVSGISFHYLVSGPLPPAYCGSLLASTPSTSYSRGSAIGFLRHSRKGIAAYGRGTTEPLCPTSLDQETRSRPRARSSRFARRASGPNRPPQPIMLLLFVSPLRHCLGSFTGRTISCKRAECLFACVSSTLHAQHSDVIQPLQLPCPERRETEKESLFHVKQRTKPGTKRGRAIYNGA